MNAKRIDQAKRSKKMYAFTRFEHSSRTHSHRALSDSISISDVKNWVECPFLAMSAKAKNIAKGSACVSGTRNTRNGIKRKEVVNRFVNFEFLVI